MSTLINHPSRADEVDLESVSQGSIASRRYKVSPCILGANSLKTSDIGVLGGQNGQALQLAVESGLILPAGANPILTGMHTHSLRNAAELFIDHDDKPI